MRKQWLLIVLFTTCVATVLSYVACTYDYFEDETNYIVYVPEVKDKTAGDCRVMIYNKAGELVGDKSATPETKDPRMLDGLFAFRLMPDDYKVYCYANTGNVVFGEVSSYETAALRLSATETEGVYQQPSDMLFYIFEHKIQHQGILRIDTAAVERYTGRITVRFKNFPADLSGLSSVRLLAEGVATTQYLKHDTLTSYIAAGDVIRHTGTAESFSYTGGVLEVDHRYFPSVESAYEKLNFTFLDSGGNAIASIPVRVTDPDTNIPIRLYHGKRIIIEIDRYLVSTINLVGWDEDIQGGGSIGAW